MAKDLVEQFDTKILTFWFIILMGASEATKATVKLLADNYVGATLLGLDVSLIATNLWMMFLGLMGLIFWKTLHREEEE